MMNIVRISKKFRFETAHALYGYDGRCKNVHGHSYTLWVTVIGSPMNNPLHTKHGMVIDFGDLKKIVNKEVVELFDHAIIFNKHTPHAALAAQLQQQGHQVILADYQPTCENMVIDFAARISQQLPDSVKLHSLRLQETETSYAEWFASDAMS